MLGLTQDGTVKLHNKLAALFGYELIKRKKHPTSETHLINLFDALGVDLVLDVGANRGQFVQRLRAQGYQGIVHSFEPVSATFRVLEEISASDSAWFVHQLAMGDIEGEAEINITGTSDLVSFLEPSAFGESRYSEIRVASTETVQVSTVSDFVCQHIDDWQHRKLFLKMDTQGYDLHVFAGAKSILGGIAGILSELSVKPIYDGMPHYLDVLRTYEDAGFSVTGVYPISRLEDFSVVEMDCMLINRRL